MEKYLTPVKAARRYDEWQKEKGSGKECTAGTMRDWMAAGKVPGAFPHGKTFLISERDLNVALDAGKVGIPTEPTDSNGLPCLTSYATTTKLAQVGIDVAHVTVLDWLRKGILPGRKVGKAWAVDRAKLERMIAAGFQPPKRGRPSNDGPDV